VILKPGPYALAELSDQGMPLWLTETYPDCLARNEHGDPWGPAYISYASETYRRISTRWLKTFVRKIILSRQDIDSGAVIMMQLCNEIGMFQWLRSGGDYSDAARKKWHLYLSCRFTLKQLGQLLRRTVDRFDSIEPPSMFCSSQEGANLYTLWHDFHRWLYADYGFFLLDLFRKEGVRVPLFTNVGGWVYGRAHEFVLNGTFQRETAKADKGIIFGVDHIPEVLGQNNMHDGIIANQICAELQRN